MSSPAEFQDASEDQQEDGLFSGMRFYLNCGADSGAESRQLGDLIESRGGEVVDKLPEDVKEGEKLYVVALYNDTRLPTVTPAYIKACCENGTLLKIENYLIPFDEFRSVIDTELQNEQQQDGGGPQKVEEKQPEETPKPEPEQDKAVEQPAEQPVEQPLVEMVQQGSPKVQETEESSDGSSDQNYPSMRSVLRANLPAHNKASFTEAEDEFILDVVRKNPTRRTTHTLYDEISHYVPNHTGNSIRHRFRVYLSKRLEFVYATDKNGKLERDEHGNLIKTKNLPPSIKKKFTADEDYLLAIGIKKQFYRDLYQVDPDTGKSLITDEDSPTAVAKRNMTMDPNHVPGTEPSFQDYRVGDRRGPIAREFFKSFGENNPTHTENAWRDRFRKFLLSYGIDNYVGYYETAKEQGQEPEPMKNLTNRVKRPGIPTPGNYNSATKRARSIGPEKASPNGSVAPSSAAAAIAATAGNGGNNLENGAANYALAENELLDEDTMNFISSLKNDLSKIESSIPFEYPQEIAEAIRNDFSNEEAIYDNVDPDTLPFPPAIASTDLFLPAFFRMSSTREFLEKLQEVISRDYEPSQAEKLVQDLCNETGVRKTFSTSILTALSGDLMVFPRYFLNMFKNNANPPMDVPGIWTREDDRMLRSNKEEDIRALIKKHGSGRMEMRKKFVEKDLI
ncbi:DNA-binding transcription factor RAP1 TDEL_0A00720 [Torulaspora delbrueckii]|uniref:DNA-binding protein RAP1 n=1 Tax=Torulaspora delbrueckii TaxID=4950 RepID=G8ZLB0_TORDE|nr:hypothetical protein TDEL_0A00720 [Torulaspora delbrueckii]CCE89404.1 hypothetical protein TDEL_0A00720 [Torulaspora delbrueckii]